MSIIYKHNFRESHNGLPEVVWSIEDGFMHFEIMETDNGWWVILSKRASGAECGRINIGHFTDEKLIEDLLLALMKAK